jgi:hypothetical protein
LFDGINAVRSILPRCWFDREKCKDGLEALKQYRKEYSITMKTYADHALHDWASHGADAFRMLAVGLESIEGSGPPIVLKLPQFQQQANGWML